MKTFKTVDRKVGFEINNKKALFKKDGEIFFSAFSTFENKEYPRWEYELLSGEIIQHRTLNPIYSSSTETDKLYNENSEILRVWLDLSFVDYGYFIELNNDFKIKSSIWDPPYKNILDNENLAIIDIPIDKIFKGSERSKFNIIVFETTDINELPDHIRKEIYNEPKSIYKYAIKNHINEFIVDSNNKLIFRFNKILFIEKPLDYLITGKKIKNFSQLPEHELKYDRANEKDRLSTIMKRFNSNDIEIESVTISYLDYEENWDKLFIRQLPYSVMYDEFFPLLNMLYSEKYNYEKDNNVTTNGIFINKPKIYKGEKNMHNVGICIMFNKLGLVHRLEGEYDSLIDYKEDLAREFRYYDNENPSESTAKFKTDGNKISWKFYENDLFTDNSFKEPKEFIEYEGEFHDYALRLSAYVHYYDQDRKRFMKMVAFEKLIFKLYEV